MEILSANFIIKDSPTAVAILDTEMRFVGHSKIWLEEFCPSFDVIKGKSYYEVLPDTPDALKAIHNACLEGAFDKNDGHKFIAANGSVQWFKWKINAWEKEDGEIGGLIIVQEDITETKRREELLRKAEKVARIGGWEIDMASSQVYWTSVTREIHEVSDDFTPTLEGGLSFYKKGEHREHISILVSEALRAGTPWDTELLIVTAKNNELWVRAKGETEVIDGKCVRIYGTLQDIDKRKRTELKYEKAAKRLTIATKESKIGIWEYDIVKNELVWDDNMYALYGVRRKDFSGEYAAWQAGLLPADKVRGDKEIAMAISGEKDFDTMFRVQWPTGEIRHIRALAVAQRDTEGKALKLIGTNWDITELKTTQLQLLRSKQAFKRTFQNSEIGLAIVNLDGTFREVNESLCQSLGYTESELRKISFEAITHPDDLTKDLALLQKIIDSEQESYQLEKRYFNKNGAVVHVILTVTAGKNINDELSYFSAQIIDISHRKKIERELMHYVEVTKGQNESLLNFAHIVSHNLRSHSSNMAMLHGFLKKEQDVTERKNLLGMLGEASESLSDTVMHLNDVIQVKLESPDKMKCINLFRTIKNVEKNLNSLLLEKNAICHVNVAEDIDLKGIPAYLDSIFLNLFTNSLRYSSPDRSPIIEIDASSVDGEVMVDFKDNGLGINLKRQSGRIFGMYKTFHNNPDAKGIGLYISKNQIEAMGGTIGVESTFGQGTTFKLNFKLNN